MEKINIFVGTDRSQQLAVKVLEHSIKRHTNMDINLLPLDNETARIPMPEDLCHGPRTGFSFARFAIPSLMKFEGRALYLDADMLVFKDIRELWNWDFQHHHVLIVGDTGTIKLNWGLPKRRIRQSSVMLIDCEKCDWNSSKLIEGLGRSYSYEQLMHELCILSEQEIGAVLPFEWNSLEHFDENTCLLHYTDMQVQPWVDPSNPLGYIWVNELRMMLEDNSLSIEELMKEIDAGSLRPSLYEEVLLPVQEYPLSQSLIDKYHQIDAEKAYVKHKEVNDAKRRRIEKVMQIEKEMTIWQLFKSLPSRDSRHPILRAKYYYYLLTH